MIENFLEKFSCFDERPRNSKLCFFFPFLYMTCIVLLRFFILAADYVLPKLKKTQRNVTRCTHVPGIWKFLETFFSFIFSSHSFPRSLALSLFPSLIFLSLFLSFPPYSNSSSLIFQLRFCLLKPTSAMWLQIYLRSRTTLARNLRNS